jgi:hypothetical protein
MNGADRIAYVSVIEAENGKSAKIYKENAKRCLYD